MGVYLRALEKKMVLWYYRTLLLGVFIAAVQVHGQFPSMEGFISIDCGGTSNYNDSVTGIPYTTDDQLIENGVIYKIEPNYIKSSLPKQYHTLRSFPGSEDRNCYVLPAKKDNKYIVRASFMYGNYDGKNSVQNNSKLIFNLYIGFYLWRRVKISDPSTTYTYEVITFISTDFVNVCLARTNSSSTPFISLLEMRPLKNTLYPAANFDNFYSILISLMRRNLGATTKEIIRYPDDPYDRIWEPFNITAYTLTTGGTIEHNKTMEYFEVPSVVLQTASVSAGVNDIIRFSEQVDSETINLVIFHLAELELLSQNDVREFNVYSNNTPAATNYTPTYLKSSSVYTASMPYEIQFILNASESATRPPFLNAFEVYAATPRRAEMTNFQDVEAMLKIKEAYKVKKNWVADPCLPKGYAWHGLNCSEAANSADPAVRVTAINLSSSGLVGQVSTLFTRLTAIQSLDLSYNNLSGKIPDILATISTLQVLNLTGNCITEIPKSLVERSKEGSFILRYDNNTNTCNSSNSTPGGNPTSDNNSPSATNKKISTPIVIVLSVVPAILLLVVVVVVFIVWRSRRKIQDVSHDVVQLPSEGLQFNVDRGGSRLPYTSHQSNVDDKDSKLPFESRQFMYRELENITKKFSRTLGKGGFGTVFHGSLEDDTEVAVKMCSLSSEQAANLFLAEVENLSGVHHKNLVSLVGYCMDRGQMALVYEYMPLGSLEDHLRGKASNGRAFSWAERLQIVIDAAQGLEYLYNGCRMPIIHRDIKSSNILLDQNLRARVSDFGLSKAYRNDSQTHVSMSAVAFTPGYADPVCFETWKSNEKTDVYSFGVVLLEIITGEPPIPHMGGVHIIERVQMSFEAGDINAIVDARLQGIYNTESVWKVTELAMRCTSGEVDQRPNMSEVVMELRETLECETAERSKSMLLMKESTIIVPSAR